MPTGNVTVDAGRTFSTTIVLAVAQKTKFGTVGEPDISVSGQKKWTVDTAVTYFAEAGRKAPSEVISVTVTGPDNLNIPSGTAVTFDDLRCGVSTPENTERGVRGGRLFWMASNVRPARQHAGDKAA